MHGVNGSLNLRELETASFDHPWRVRNDLPRGQYLFSNESLDHGVADAKLSGGLFQREPLAGAPVI